MAELVTLEGELLGRPKNNRAAYLALRNRIRRANMERRRAIWGRYLETRRRAKSAGRHAFLSADQNEELGSFASRTFRKAKNVAKKAKKVALKISRIALGPIDTIIEKALEQKVHTDGNVIKPSLRKWAINNSNTLLMAAGPQAAMAKPILPKLIDRAIVRLKRKYKTGKDDTFDFVSGIDKKYLIGGGALLVLIVFMMMRKKENVTVKVRR